MKNKLGMRTLDDPIPDPPGSGDRDRAAVSPLGIAIANGTIGEFGPASGKLISLAFYADGLRTQGWRVKLPIGRPNLWRRFWYWALLGWKWEKV